MSYEDNERFNAELDLFLRGELPKNHIFRLGFPGEILQKTGFPEKQTIELSASRLAEKIKDKKHPFDGMDIKNLVSALNEPVAVFSYGDTDKAQNVIVEFKKDGNNFLAGIHFDQQHRETIVSDIRTIFPKNNHNWLNWINQGKLLYADIEKLRTVIDQQQTNSAEINSHGSAPNGPDETAQQRTNSAEVSYLHLEPIINLIQKNEAVKHFFPAPGYPLKTGMENSQEWPPDFPPVMRFVDLENACAKPWKFLEAHPDYDAAKNKEDRVAALRLVRDFLRTPENHTQLLALKKKYPGAIIVPVHALEAGGENKIPEALAEYIGMNTGLDVDDTIVQTNRVHRTGTDEWHRFAFRPSYEGTVKGGQNYIIVDDVFSLGGSFNELRRFIESDGGKVVQTIALATGRSGPEIALNPNTLKNLVDRYGKNKLESFLKEIDLYGGNCKALTEPEARALRRAPSLDEARDRILAAKQAGRSPVVPGNVQETQSQASLTNPQDNPRRGFRR